VSRRFRPVRSRACSRRVDLGAGVEMRTNMRATIAQGKGGGQQFEKLDRDWQSWRMPRRRRLKNWHCGNGVGQGCDGRHDPGGGMSLGAGWSSQAVPAVRDSAGSNGQAMPDSPCSRTCAAARAVHSARVFAHGEESAGRFAA